MTEQQAIDREFAHNEQRARTRAIAITGLFLVLVFAFCVKEAFAQSLTAPTRISPYDWACLASNGAVLSNHQRFDTAFVACYNNAEGAEIVGGRYRISRPAPPDPEPTACPAQPGDESREGVCPAGTTGSWTQTRTYSSVPSPICWQAGEWLPASAPSGACTAEPTALTAPVLGAPTVAPHTTAGRYTVTLTWQQVPGATSYEVRRCVGCDGPADPGMTLIKSDVTGTSYDNTNLPPGFSYRYKVRAMRGDEAGPMSGIVGAATPAETPAPPPPAGTGTATLQWTPPTTNTDGSTLTNLAGYRILYGVQATSLVSTIQVPNPALTTYIVDNLPSGTWYFAMTAYTSNGYESARSNVASRVVP